MAPSSATTSDPSLATAVDEVIMSTDFHVTSIPDVCMVFPCGTKIFANVAVLRNASPVFLAMLGPHFQEGQAIIDNPGSTQEIEFPEDDPDAMLALTRLLHHRYKDLEAAGQLPAEKIRDIAIAADKYDLCPVVKSASATLFCLDNKRSQDLWYLLSAAYIVGHREVFKRISVRLLRDCSSPYFEFVSNCKSRREADMWMGGELYYARAWTLQASTNVNQIGLLEEKRARLRSKFANEFISEAGNIMCENPVRFSDVYNWPDSVCLSYGHSLDYTIENFREAMMRDTDHGYKSPGTLECLVSDIAVEISKGICYDCVGSYGSHEEHSATKPKTKTTNDG